jgi:hypothetical protein
MNIDPTVSHRIPEIMEHLLCDRIDFVQLRKPIQS